MKMVFRRGQRSRTSQRRLIFLHIVILWCSSKIVQLRDQELIRPVSTDPAVEWHQGDNNAIFRIQVYWFNKYIDKRRPVVNILP
jgi:hypothetical protein